MSKRLPLLVPFLWVMTSSACHPDTAEDTGSEQEISTVPTSTSVSSPETTDSSSTTTTGTTSTTTTAPTSTQTSPPTKTPSRVSDPRCEKQTADAPSLGYTWAYLEPGVFTMGCTPEQEPDCEADERPNHEVTIPHALCVGHTEVTQAQWAALMGENPAYHKGCEDCPVEMVRWTEAIDLANAWSVFDGLAPVYEVTHDGVTWDEGVSGYRLATEAEWEYAARATDGTRYAGSDDLDEVAWHAGNAGDRTHPVGELAPNAFDLYDMSGNVEEWVWSHYTADYTTTEPTGSRDRVERGGAYDVDAGHRVSDRDGSHEVGVSPARGLRLVRTVGDL
jgi:sulfatase modifying factor 1